MTPAEDGDLVWNDDVDLASGIVRDAARLAARMRAAGVDTDVKSSRSDLVTDADRAAEELVVDRLREARPEDAIVGEEGAAVAGTSGRTWVIDPVDGTFNFVRGLSWWCSALALRAAGERQPDRPGALGAVHTPHDDLTWVGGAGRPTTRNGAPLPQLTDRPLADCTLATYLHPPHMARPSLAAAFAAMAGGAQVVRMAGSGSMDLAAVADGRMDLWCQHSVPEWDWLPGSALVAGVGGATATVDAGGVTWSMAGPPTAVAECVARLRGA